jgi:hypothetical protein
MNMSAGLVKDQLWNHGGQFQTDQVEKRRIEAFELLVRQHECEVQFDVMQAKTNM